MSKGHYVIITPAHNEEQLIEHTLSAMAAQTVLPMRWIIVNDGSTDRTARIVEDFARGHSFVELVNRKRRDNRDFAEKVLAFECGLQNVADVDYSYIGNIDADISFEPEYFENLLKELDRDPSLGITGGEIYTSVGENFVSYDRADDSVGGAVQFFRRKCFEEIGGYPRLEYGGIDSAAEITARSMGWSVRKYRENKVLEHRPTGSVGNSPVSARVRVGKRFYALGYSPVYFTLRCLKNITEYPAILGSAASMYGYLHSFLTRHPRALPPSTVAYLRRENKKRIREVWMAICGQRKTSSSEDESVQG